MYPISFHLTPSSRKSELVIKDNKVVISGTDNPALREVYENPRITDLDTTSLRIQLAMAVTLVFIILY